MPLGYYLASGYYPTITPSACLVSSFILLNDLLALARRKFLEGVVRTRNVPEVGLIRGTKVADCAGRGKEGERGGEETADVGRH